MALKTNQLCNLKQVSLIFLKLLERDFVRERARIDSANEEYLSQMHSVV